MQLLPRGFPIVFTVAQYFLPWFVVKQGLPPDSYSSITVPNKEFEQITEVMIEYECESIADAVATASTIALEHDEATLPSFSLNDSLNEDANLNAVLLP